MKSTYLPTQCSSLIVQICQGDTWSRSMYARTLEEAWVSCCCWCGWECRGQGGCGDDDVQGAGALWSRCLVAPLSGWRRLPGPKQGCWRSCPRTQNPSGDQRRCGAAQNDSTPHGGGAPPGFAACARRRQRKRSCARKGWGFVDFFGLKPPDTGREYNLSAEGGAWLWGGYVSGGWWVGGCIKRWVVAVGFGLEQLRRKVLFAVLFWT